MTGRETPSNAATMSDREALAALAAPPPEPFHQVRPSAEDNARWQLWHDRYLAALDATRTGA